MILICSWQRKGLKMKLTGSELLLTKFVLQDKIQELKNINEKEGKPVYNCKTLQQIVAKIDHIRKEGQQ